MISQLFRPIDKNIWMKNQNLYKLNIFSEEIKVRFLDLNSGDHVSNQIILGYYTEIVSEFLLYHKMSLSNVFGNQLFIRAFSNVKYKKPIKYPSTIISNLHVSSIEKYKIEFYIELKNKCDDLYCSGFMECVLVNPENDKLSLIPNELKDMING